MEEKEHVFGIIQKALRAVKKEDIGKIKDLSNQTIHSASIYQDPDNIAIAVILYSLSKLIERKKTLNMQGWNEFLKFYSACLEKALIALRRDEIDLYREQIENIEEKINKLSPNIKSYVQDVFRKAQINKASKIYEHGISLEKTAKILGLSIWDLNSYIGQSNASDLSLTYTQDIKQRLKTAEEIF